MGIFDFFKSNKEFKEYHSNGNLSFKYYENRSGEKEGLFRFYNLEGQKIGEVGMTGFTSGPHVCYRFWKNGRQVDPLKQKLPEAKPISDSLKRKYLTYMAPIKDKLDSMKSNLNFDEKTNNSNP